MNRRQEEKLSMHYAVIAACDKQNYARSALAAIATGYAAKTTIVHRQSFRKRKSNANKRE